jgi:hypothetical protein
MVVKFPVVEIAAAPELRVPVFVFYLLAKRAKPFFVLFIVLFLVPHFMQDSHVAIPLVV